MKAATREWVRCAEEDFDVAAALLRRRTKTAANSIGFHCQQCVEKYLKARLEEGNLNMPKTHDLVALLQLLLPVEPLWASFAPALRRLNEETTGTPTTMVFRTQLVERGSVAPIRKGRAAKAASPR